MPTLSLSEKVLLIFAVVLLYVSCRVSRVHVNHVLCPKPSLFQCYGDEQCGQCMINERLYFGKCVRGLCNLCIEEVMVPT